METMNSDGILGTIGNTPIVRLNKLFKDAPFQVWVKLEMTNPGGSIKDRTALNIIKRGLEKGEIDADTTIIESSSGNLGIGLAQVCHFIGLKFICVVDPKTTTQNLKMMQVYGAQIDMVPKPDPTTGEYLHARVARVKELREQIPNSYWTNQYANPYNPGAHHQTMHEIAHALNKKIDYLFVSVSTCGTLRGCREYLRFFGMTNTKVVAVDAKGSAIYNDPPAKRLIPGHGAARVPELMQPDLQDDVVHITDIDCIVGCRRLLHTEAILAGGSSGGVMMAIEKKWAEIPEGSIVAAIIPDGGDRYLDTIYTDAWVEKNFGDISHLWSNDVK
ncbi:MAG: 2,3-diaminopropionate biosynthesis protein SbnA [Desulfamplus sp.]|nr:2,3-diaminopropionate biosynthesis protein SbnA [Desulfamplus sp.]